MNLSSQKQQLIEEKTKLNLLQDLLQPRKKKLQDEIREMEAEFNAINADLLSQIDESFAKTNQLDTSLRQDIIKAYEENPEKKQLGEGMSIRVTETITISDKASATEWAKKEATFLLVVDEKQLKDLAKKQSFPFIEKTEKVTAIISF